jgi:hypothetical protein
VHRLKDSPIPQVLVSKYNSLGDNRYYDVASASSFAFDHQTQKASAVQSYTPDSQHDDSMYYEPPSSSLVCHSSARLDRAEPSRAWN